MKLTAQQVFDAHQLLTQVILERRPMPLKGAYRLARLHAKLLPEFKVIEENRNGIILDLAKGERAVPDDKMDEFRAQWGELAGDVIELDVQPIPLAMLDLNPDGEGCFNAQELLTLGDLVAE